MHATYSGGSVSVADATAYANAWRGFWATRFGPCVGPNVTYNTFEVADLSSPSGAVYSNITPVVGTHAQTTIPPLSAAVVVSWKVGIRFRGGHCRTYLPYGQASDITSGNVILGVYQTLVQNAAAGFLTDVNGITSGTLAFQLAMVSYFTHRQMRPTGIPFVVTGATVHGRVDTVRRRLGKEF